MNITIIAIGKNKDKNLLEISNEYLKRNRWKIDIIELESKEKDSTKIKQKEGELLLSKVKPPDNIIILEEKGKEYFSPDFAKFMQKLQLDNLGNVKFIIGGASGLSDDVRQRANHIISLGKMTYPHQLARILLLEQLYRAWTILENRSYHK